MTPMTRTVVEGPGAAAAAARSGSLGTGRTDRGVLSLARDG